MSSRLRGDSKAPAVAKSTETSGRLNPELLTKIGALKLVTPAERAKTQVGLLSVRDTLPHEPNHTRINVTRMKESKMHTFAPGIAQPEIQDEDGGLSISISKSGSRPRPRRRQKCTLKSVRDPVKMDDLISMQDALVCFDQSMDPDEAPATTHGAKQNEKVTEAPDTPDAAAFRNVRKPFLVDQQRTPGTTADRSRKVRSIKGGILKRRGEPTEDDENLVRNRDQETKVGELVTEKALNSTANEASEQPPSVQITIANGDNKPRVKTSREAEKEPEKQQAQATKHKEETKPEGVVEQEKSPKPEKRQEVEKPKSPNIGKAEKRNESQRAARTLATSLKNMCVRKPQERSNSSPEAKKIKMVKSKGGGVRKLDMAETKNGTRFCPKDVDKVTESEKSKGGKATKESSKVAETIALFRKLEKS